VDSDNHPFVLTLGILYGGLGPIPVVHEVGVRVGVIFVVEVIPFVVPAVEEVATLPLLKDVTIGELQDSRLFLFPSIAPARNVVDLWAYHNEPGDRSVGWIVEVVFPTVIAPLGLAGRVGCQTVRTSVDEPLVAPSCRCIIEIGVVSGVMVSRDDLNVAKLVFEVRAPPINARTSVGCVVAQVTQPQKETRVQGL